MTGRSDFRRSRFCFGRNGLTGGHGLRSYRFFGWGRGTCGSSGGNGCLGSVFCAGCGWDRRSSGFWRRGRRSNRNSGEYLHGRRSWRRRRLRRQRCWRGDGWGRRSVRGSGRFFRCDRGSCQARNFCLLLQRVHSGDQRGDMFTELFVVFAAPIFNGPRVDQNCDKTDQYEESKKIHISAAASSKKD